MTFVCLGQEEQIRMLNQALELKGYQLDAAWAEITRLREALAYYASARNWNAGYVNRDWGLRANRALRRQAAA
jgi:hypothetical protein